jgi:hypothetical protein
MLMDFTDSQASGLLGVKLIGHFRKWTTIYLQVQGPNMLRISNNLNDLTTFGPSGALQGIQLTAATTTGLVALTWIGPMYGIASAPGTLVEVIDFSEADPSKGCSCRG